MIAARNSAAALLRLPRRAKGLIPALVNSIIPLLGLPGRAAVALATAVAIVIRKHCTAAEQCATGDQQQKNGFHGSFRRGTIDFETAYQSQSTSSRTRDAKQFNDPPPCLECSATDRYRHYRDSAPHPH